MHGQLLRLVIVASPDLTREALLEGSLEIEAGVDGRWGHWSLILLVFTLGQSSGRSKPAVPRECKRSPTFQQ